MGAFWALFYPFLYGFVRVSSFQWPYTVHWSVCVSVCVCVCGDCRCMWLLSRTGLLALHPHVRFPTERHLSFYNFYFFTSIFYVSQVVSGNEREDGELKDRFGRAITYTYNRHIHTHIQTYKHTNGLYRSLKAVATNDSSQERTKQGSKHL